MRTSHELAGYYWIYVDHLRRRSVRRALAVVQREAWQCTTVEATRRSLVAILVVETHERPALMRAVERVVQVGGRRGTTCGPLQLRNAPWGLPAAVRIAAERLGKLDALEGEPDWGSVARCWHGPSSEASSRVLKYADALRLADRAVSSRPNRPGWAVSGD